LLLSWKIVSGRIERFKRTFASLAQGWKPECLPGES
jgi:hypothetical protein